MGKIIKRLFGITDKNVDRIGYWTPVFRWLFGLIGGSFIMSWIGSRWEMLADHGWAAVALFGIATTATLIVVLSMAAVSWRYFHPLGNLPVAAEPNSPEMKPTYSSDPLADALDKPAYNEILAFCLDTLLPACNGIADLQRMIDTGKMR
ncbi:hypothetical protein NKH74_24090 [Mesorhizobium sp. M0933]|uniref:hypothetical protein n=1 Tax=Mesorhizobium sp. M0933 TaxID=2957030 RepID=UPI00333D4FFC